MQDELRAQPPPEEAKVAGMAQHTVDASGHESVALLALDLHRVVEVTACLRHGERADALADDHQHQPDDERQLRGRYGGRPLRVSLWEEEVRQETFGDGGAMSHVVRPPVRAEQEGRHGRMSRVVPRRDEVFEEMEQAERSEEEGHAPKRDREDEQDDRDGRADPQNDAKQERPDRDPGQRFLPSGVVGGVETGGFLHRCCCIRRRTVDGGCSGRWNWWSPACVRGLLLLLLLLAYPSNNKL